MRGRGQLELDPWLTTVGGGDSANPAMVATPLTLQKVAPASLFPIKLLLGTYVSSYLKKLILKPPT